MMKKPEASKDAADMLGVQSRPSDDGLELVTARWGMPSPPSRHHQVSRVARRFTNYSQLHVITGGVDVKSADGVFLHDTLPWNSILKLKGRKWLWVPSCFEPQ